MKIVLWWKFRGHFYSLSLHVVLGFTLCFQVLLCKTKCISTQMPTKGPYCNVTLHRVQNVLHTLCVSSICHDCKTTLQEHKAQDSAENLKSTVLGSVPAPDPSSTLPCGPPGQHKTPHLFINLQLRMNSDGVWRVHKINWHAGRGVVCRYRCGCSP